MDWVVWFVMFWAVFAGGAVTGSRFCELSLRQRERRVAAGRANLNALRRELVVARHPGHG